MCCNRLVVFIVCDYLHKWNSSWAVYSGIIFAECNVCTLSRINPSVTARFKISQNVDILAKVYLVHLKVKHCQTLHVVSTFTGQNESTVF